MPAFGKGPAPATRAPASAPKSAPVAAAPRPVGRPPGSTNKPAATQGAAPAAVKAAAPAGHSPESAAATAAAQLRFYTAAAAYYEAQLVQIGKAPAAKAAVVAPAPVAAKAAPLAAKPASAPKVTPAPAQVAAVTASGDLATMTRLALVEMATNMGLDTTGKKADDLRQMITEAGGAGAAPAVAEEGGEDVVAQRAAIMMQLIEDNLEVFEPMIGNPAAPMPDALNCGGDCARCPNPEQHPTAADQVNACYMSAHEALGLQPSLPV